MRVVLQRVARARVAVEQRTVGDIGRGFLLLVGFAPVDDELVLRWMAEKILSLRVFSDEHGKMNMDVADVDGDILVVSQFTLYGDMRRGRRPSFIDAAAPEHARQCYDAFVGYLRDATVGRVETGEFGAMMQVELVNDGPVTLLLER